MPFSYLLHCLFSSSLFCSSIHLPITHSIVTRASPLKCFCRCFSEPFHFTRGSYHESFPNFTLTVRLDFLSQVLTAPGFWDGWRGKETNFAIKEAQETGGEGSRLSPIVLTYVLKGRKGETESWDGEEYMCDGKRGEWGIIHIHRPAGVAHTTTNTHTHTHMNTHIHNLTPSSSPLNIISIS